jgi:ubiquinone biosynthesis protein
MPEKNTSELNNKSRLTEIRQVLMKNKITRGITPEKLRIILEELGPTFIKLGQIMALHSDILPQAYCDELMKLDSNVSPMPFAVVEKVINHSYRENWREYFSTIDETPIGSASIAQVHHAVLKNGKEVIIKVQREGIYDTMARDISLLHRLVKLMPPVGDLKIKNIVDLDMVLDEMWTVAQEEMDFLKEAANMDEFRRNNRDVVYVAVPEIYHEYTTQRVLVMEYIDGWAINDAENLKKAGYDLNEIGRKFVNNFIKQVMDDGFFHADPHPGNVKIRDGKIVWIDMGMMGRLTEHDRRIMVKGVKGIALHDVTMVEDAVLELGDFQGTPNRARLYADLKEFLEKYGNTSMGDVDVAETMNALMEIMKANHIAMPHGMTMLCRGLAQMEGVLASISPSINMFEIAYARMQDDWLANLDLKQELKTNARHLYRAAKKGSEIPSLTVDLLKEILQGQADVNIRMHSSATLNEVIASAVRNLVIGVCVAALLISSSIVSTTEMKPIIFGIPALGFAGYAFALAVSAALVIRYLYHKFRNPNKIRKKRKK